MRPSSNRSRLLYGPKSLLNSGGGLNNGEIKPGSSPARSCANIAPTTLPRAHRAEKSFTTGTILFQMKHQSDPFFMCVRNHIRECTNPAMIRPGTKELIENFGSLTVDDQ